MLRLLLLLFFIKLYVLSQVFAPIEAPKYDEKKAQLGKSLFYDTRLSPSGTMSCERCHNLYWNSSGTNKDNIKISLDETINTPTILNSALNYLFFKDGRIRDIKEQVVESITDLNQLGSNKELVESKVRTNPQYRSKFNSLYKDGVTFENIVDAIVHFQTALITPNSKFDRFLKGDDSALSQREKDGFELFKKIGCKNCHSGVNLGANLYYDMNLDRNLKDDMKSEVTKYKVPGLRNISKTSPYLYNGKQADLKEAIRHILKLRTFNDLSEEQIELIYQFLLTLDGEKPEILR